jgi:hypothetical protein
VKTERIGSGMSEVDDNNIPHRSSKQTDAELDRAVGIDRADHMRMIVPDGFLHPDGRETARFCHLPECRTISPDKPAVKDGMGQETRICSISKNARVEPPVELHDRTKGGIPHESH